MTVEEEWEKLISENSSIYIYGAGNIGKKILDLLHKTKGAEKKIKGFLVSDLAGNPVKIQKYPVMIPEDIVNREDLVLISVTDIYQETILSDLLSMGFKNVVIAYKYSFLVNDLDCNISKTMVIDTNELMLCQYKENQFNRYDIVVRLLAIKHYYGQNAYGFNLYERMQSIRSEDENYGNISRKRFVEVIKSFEENGYNSNSELVIDEKLHLVDGSHRLALALYFAVPRLKVRIVERKEEIYYGKDWFVKSFSSEECKIIEETFLLSEKSWFGSIKGILWPSVADYFDEIVETINDQYEVSNIKDYVFDTEGFREIVYKIYQVDSIAEWKINTKLKHMTPFSPYRIRTFDIGMGNPEFRMKKAGVGVLSNKGAELKDSIRKQYMGRVPGYFSDIIFHTADNFYQSNYMESLFCDEASNKQI